MILPLKERAIIKEALERDPNFAPALIALGEAKLRNAFYSEALEYLLRAEKSVDTVQYAS